MGKKKRSQGDWTPPPKSAERQAADREVRNLRAAVRQPPLPQRRLILALIALALATFLVFLVFWVPAQTLVSDLRSRGVAVVAEITTSPKNKYGEAGNVTIRFNGPRGEVETVLTDWGGKRPEGLLPGSAVPVTYDPQDPSRVLTTEWVEDPPGMTLPMLVTLVLTPVFLVGVILLVVRRRTLLREREQTAPA
ncbi:DUF3592 domain-containing protein [Streptomyces griseoincarnatus]|uniref:DUF3592 domain-containing protein n=1 Tax=unclassified Streptomyces TaxID=2593676 RepID=UPI0012EA2C9D|nr:MULTISPECIES: DUF3592 domain-containing protein [unclassified Streptomyces]MBQ0973432.1 DUF3592 domain-containing protein [Streptomyces sp. RK31]MUT88516.1 DUF3592 domain-containing protein [Streptomyces sp. Z38]